jgi:hypothetical protein
VSIANPAGRLRGTAAGLLTAALAVAAHSVGSGAPPTGAVVAQLAVLAATVGALAATIARAADARVLLGLLAAGQLCGHVILSAVGHSHAAATAPPAAAMLVAHVVAVGAGALLIAASDRLCRAVSRAVRVAVRIVAAPVAVAPVVVIGDADQPLRSALQLAASVSPRGPPVSRYR